ncbi:MAG: glycosyltransferase [Negativibacillus sp.]|nr:glycosyltransferase [Negativibacillus sp.]
MLTFILSRGIPTEQYPTNGVFEFDQACALQEAGCQVVFLALDLRSARRVRRWGFQSFTRNGVAVRVLSVPLGNLPKKIFYPIGSWALQKLYARAVKEFGKPDVLHAHFTDYGYLAAKLKETEQVPLVLTEHSSLVNQDKLPSDIEQAAKLAFARADKLIAVSPALAEKMREHSHRSVLWIPDMVDTELFSYTDEHEQMRSLWEETELEGGEFSFLSCGNLRKVKRMDVLIQAFARAFRDCPKVHLTICGQGEEEGNLRKLIYDLKMENRIELAGIRPREEIAQRLQQADCFVLASVSETFGVSYLEALSCGVPVIATRCGGPECFVNDHNGLMVEPDDVEGLASAMLTMYCNGGSYNRAAIAQEVRNHYSSQAVAARLMEQYEQLTHQSETQQHKQKALVG